MPSPSKQIPLQTLQFLGKLDQLTTYCPITATINNIHTNSFSLLMNKSPMTQQPRPIQVNNRCNPFIETDKRGKLNATKPSSSQSFLSHNSFQITNHPQLNYHDNPGKLNRQQVFNHLIDALKWNPIDKFDQCRRYQ